MGGLNLSGNKAFGKKALIAISLGFLLITLIIVGYDNYAQHKDTVINQQQEHLLTTAKSISRSLDTYIRDKADSLYVLSKNPMISDVFEGNGNSSVHLQHEEAIKTFHEKFSSEMESVLLLREDGTLVYKYPEESNAKEKIIDSSLISKVLISKNLFVSKEYRGGSNQFFIDILQPVIDNDEVKGILISTIDLNKLYNRLIHPVRPGKKGYAMVKNKEGIIVMHPVTEQIGIDSINVRKKKYPEFNWQGLEELNRKQVEEGEGYHIYNSRWWQDNKVKWIKKINAYTTIKTGDIAWIISVQMGYSEIEEPMRGTLINIFMIALIITVFILIVSYIIFKYDKNRKATEIEMKYLKELNKTWERLIKSEARLRHSQKLQTIAVLTSGVAHEFNNLITPMIVYSELISESISSEDKIQEEISEIKKCAYKAKEIIQQILAYSRNDNETSNFKPIRIDYVINESIKLIKSLLPNNIRIVDNICSSGLIHGSSTQLQQVLLNLYTNSYHAMKPSGGVLEIRADTIDISCNENNEHGLPPGKYVKLHISDTGSGMDKETLNQIFEPFFTTKETGEGTGLGLSVVQGIIKNHNGKILVKSEIYVGTEVEIYLPAIEENYINLNEF